MQLFVGLSVFGLLFRCFQELCVKTEKTANIFIPKTAEVEKMGLLQKLKNTVDD